MKRFILSNLTAIFAALLLGSCGGDDVESPQDSKDSLTPLPVSQHFLSQGMTFNSAEDAKTFHFKSATPWTAQLEVQEDEEKSVLWCAIDKTEGEAGNAAINVYCFANKGNSDRKATLTISNQSTSLRFSISQTYEMFLQLTEYDVIVSDSSNFVSIGVTYNVDHYTVEIPAEATSWISLVGTRAKKESVEEFQILPNPHPARNASIPFNACDKDGTILFTQYLYVSQISAPSYLIGRQESFTYTGSCRPLIKALEGGKYDKTISSDDIQADFTLGVADSIASLRIPSLVTKGASLSQIQLNQLILSDNEEKTTTIALGPESTLEGTLTIDGTIWQASEAYMEFTADAWEMNIAQLEIFFGENKEYVLSIKYSGKRD
ncbi:MAG: BACON domain-containing protein [Bacteroidaceae bacterium]|nr:BACON domain-containing protein [Bacteroidaceae bacterium]